MGCFKEALFYDKLADGRVFCRLCPHECKIRPGHCGACGVRLNEGGVLYTLVYNKIVARNIDPIEKKPLFHFQPGSSSYSIATAGCNMRCTYCQNWSISQQPKGRQAPHATAAAAEPEGFCLELEEAEHHIVGELITPGQIVTAAERSKCQSISYTYTEPTIFYELAYDTAALAKSKGLKNVFVTNGYTSAEPLRQLATVLDAANVDLKFFNEQTHRRITGARLQPVVETIRRYKELGVWVEVTTLLIPGLNDSDEELRQMAEFICSVGPEVPWHLSQFYPTYKMTDRPRTPVSTLDRGREIGVNAGLRYVYEGNIPGQGAENSYCHACQSLLIQRLGFFVLSNQIQDGKCPHCQARIDGVEMNAQTNQQ